jgi:hypothetical protein
MVTPIGMQEDDTWPLARDVNGDSLHSANFQRHMSTIHDYVVMYCAPRCRDS